MNKFFRGFFITLALIVITVIQLVPVAVMFSSPVACIAHMVLVLNGADAYYIYSTWKYWLILTAVFIVVLSVRAYIKGSKEFRKTKVTTTKSNKDEGKDE